MKKQQNLDWEPAKDNAENVKLILEDCNLEGLMKKGRFLDLGCGDGKDLHEIQELYPEAQYFGIDFSSESSRSARQNNSQAYIIKGDFTSIPFKADMFEVIFSNNIFDYSDGRPHRSALFTPTFKVCGLGREIYRVLKSGGIYVVHEEIESHETEQLKKIGLTQIYEEVFRVFQKFHPPSQRTSRCSKPD